MVQQNAMLAEKTSEASGSMRDKAKELEDLMQFFKVDLPYVPEQHDTALEESAPEKAVAEQASEVAPSPEKSVKRVYVPPQYEEDDDEWEEF
jgi:pyruvate-formate lyase-activating enzyme